MKHLLDLTEKWKTNPKIIFNNRFCNEKLQIFKENEKNEAIIEKLSPDWSVKKRLIRE